CFEAGRLGEEEGGMSAHRKASLCEYPRLLLLFTQRTVCSAVQGGADLAEQALLLLDMLPPDGGETPEELGLLVAQVARDFDADLDEPIDRARPAAPGDALAVHAHD